MIGAIILHGTQSLEPRSTMVTIPFTGMLGTCEGGSELQKPAENSTRTDTTIHPRMKPPNGALLTPISFHLKVAIMDRPLYERQSAYIQAFTSARVPRWRGA